MKARRTRGRMLRACITAMVIALCLSVIGVAAAADTASSGATVNIEIGDNFFNPAAVTVNVGDTIVWTHKGQRPHDVTADNGVLNSPRRLMNGATYSFTATTPGTIKYQCTIHAGMEATITVQGAPAAAPRTGAGGFAAAAMQQRQQLLALGTILVAGSAAVTVLRRRRGI